MCLSEAEITKLTQDLLMEHVRNFKFKQKNSGQKHLQAILIRYGGVEPRVRV